MQIMYDNEIIASGKVCDTADSDYPVSNLIDTRLSRVLRTTGNDDQRIEFDFGSSVTISRICIVGHNLLSDCSISFFTDDDSNGYFDTIDWNANIIIHQMTAITATSITLIIDNPSASYVEIGYIFIGDFLQLPNMKIDQELTEETTAKVAFSSSGQAYGKDGYVFRKPKINFPAMTDAHKSGLQTMFDEVKTINPFICAIWANRLDIEPALYCVLNQKTLKFKRSDIVNAPWSSSIELREVF